MPQVRNKVTGTVTIYDKNGNANTVPQIDLSYWQSQGWSTTKPSSPAAPAAQAGTVTIYDKNGNANTVPKIDLSYWQGQGWSTTKPVASESPSSPAAPVTDITAPVVTAEFKDTDAYKALPQEMKAYVDLSYNLIQFGGEAEAQLFANAIKQAQAVADPYYKTQLALAKAETLGSIAKTNNDYETRSEIIRRTRDELLADVSANKEFLSLEQQAEISRTARAYDEDLLSIADEAAEKGLTFATGARSRAIAEERRGTQYADVVESSGRRFNIQKRELELKASRGDVDAQKQLEALSRDRGFILKDIGRKAEEVLGSANLPGSKGYVPTGGTLGEIEEKKRRAVVQDTGAFFELQKGFI